MDSFRVRRARKKSSFHRGCTPEAQSPLVGERHKVELNYLDTPLSGILNGFCYFIDVHVGVTISLVALSNEENEPHATAQKVRACGLRIFYCATILTKTGDLLAIVMNYCCDPRNATSDEFQNIDRVTHLVSCPGDFVGSAPRADRPQD